MTEPHTRTGERVPYVHILRTPMKEVAAFSEGERYCFVCRKRRIFMQIVTMPRPQKNSDTWMYYGPTRHIECIKCGTRDSDCFPGTCWEYRFDD